MDHEYSLIDRVLHRFALGTNLVPLASFDIETALQKPDNSRINEQHIFVSGLARAGTTVLMRIFHETGRFRSLTYRDMPFILAPGLWGRMSGRFRESGDLKERAHGDSLLVDFDSPEAFDEVFWRVFNGKDYIKKRCLEPHDVDDETLEKFRTYVALILMSSGSEAHHRYLSKNNNNILRIPAIKKAFPNALVIIPFRSPVQHANSLLRQHLRFSDKENQDGFTRDYMTWLGHFEFGPAHRPFVFSPSQLDVLKTHTPDSLDYWLLIWCETYEYLLKNTDGNVVFISYENLCTNPDEVLGSLFTRAGLLEDLDQIETKLSASTSSVSATPDPSILERAQQLNASLESRAQENLQQK